MQDLINPILSVIVPVYNAEKHLRNCVDSILEQSFKNLELILVNDGSTDGSLSICREYERNDKRVVVVDKQNEGAGPTRNTGIEKARGEYLVFPDSDDWLDITTYEMCIQTIERENADLVIFGMKIHIFDDVNNQDVEVVEKSYAPCALHGQRECRENYSKLFSRVNLNSPCNKIYKKELIDRHNLCFPDMRRMQDCVFNIHYYEHIQSVCVMPQTFYNWRWHLDEIEKKKLPKDYVDFAARVHQTQIQTINSWDGIDTDTTPFDEMFASTVESAVLTFSPVESGFWHCYGYIKNVVTKDYIRNFYGKYLNKHNKTRKIQLAIKYRMCLLLTAYRLYISRRK